MSKKKLNHLFITYDGLLDPLGKSQILPYIISIKSPQRKINILSFEKKERAEKQKNFFNEKRFVKKIYIGNIINFQTI